MELLKNLNWRYATKRFISSRKVSGEDLEKLKEAIQLSVSSYGLQLYKVIIIADQELKERLRAASWDQRQITECSHLFVFCNYTDVTAEHIDNFITLKAKTQGIDQKNLTKNADFLKVKVLEKTEQEKISWLKRQPYIALANLLMACAELKIDACPMEGFEPDQYNDILGLDEKGLNAIVIAAVGYRSEEDVTQSAKKVRKSAALLFDHI